MLALTPELSGFTTAARPVAGFASGYEKRAATDYGRKDLPLSTSLEMLNNDHISPLFSAAAEAVEEAIINALLAGESMSTASGTLVPALDADVLLRALSSTGWSKR